MSIVAAHLQPRDCKSLIIIDLIRNSRQQFPNYIPLFEKESTGPSRTLADRPAEYQLRVSPTVDPLRKWFLTNFQEMTEGVT